jgi:plastocyanin
MAAAKKQDEEHRHDALNGPLANATVSFGGWPVGGKAPLDRTVLPEAPLAPNVHALLPQTVTIKAGGTVNYILAGFHQILVYGNGKQPSDVSLEDLLPIPGAPPPTSPPFVGLITDDTDRVFRGLSPIGAPQDRVEVVQFPNPGLYLVICAVSVHFRDGMIGWVRVLP